MTVELAERRAVNRPWGVSDPGVWAADDSVAIPKGLIGEIWYERPGAPATPPALLLKILLTGAPLSIQVHPDDELARSIGLPNGKSEAWHVLAAAPDARVALGLKERMTSQQLRVAIVDGSIADAVAWRPVAADDTIMVPAGTIHAIGGGLVIAEIQQRSDSTFRLFDFGRSRELHVESAIAASLTERAGSQQQPRRISAQRLLLASDSHFEIERFDLPPGDHWTLDARRETWVLVLAGSAEAERFSIATGDALFAEEDEIKITAGENGLVAMVAHAGKRPIADNLKRIVSTAEVRDNVETSAIASPPEARLVPSTPAALRKIAFIGNHLPRRCGIATFTHELHQAVALSRPVLATSVVAMNDAGRQYAYPDCVEIEIEDDELQSYVRAAAAINRSGAEVVSLQHEFGIFGGNAGSHIVELLKRLSMPVVTTLHTVLQAPSAGQHAVMAEIVSRSARIVVMAQKGRALLRSVYGVPDDVIDVIPHGIPDVPFVGTQSAKVKLGFDGKTVILTFGLLSPSKGIEKVLEAMPDIVEACPTAVYVVLGASHPNLVRQQGETYRESLKARVRELGLGAHVVFIDQFVDQATLLDFIAACDVYVTPYLNEAQMTSGTLAYSFGLGKAVVSTPYWHASELLAGGRGIIVPFGDTRCIGREIASLLTDEPRREAIRERAYKESRSMTWARTAAAYLQTFEAVSRRPRLAAQAVTVRNGRLPVDVRPPEIRTDHLVSMCDSTGLLQHAVHCVPDRAHGYCVDDNARALLLSVLLDTSGAPRLARVLATRFAAFIQHAWNPDTRRFRNFMSYDRRWLEPQGSEDSHARTLWALGVCAGTDLDHSRREWAAALFQLALPSVGAFTSPRAWAFTLLGLDAYCARYPADATCVAMRIVLAGKLLALLTTVETSGWTWFEDELAYDNARLPQALLVTGDATSNPDMVNAGLRALRWLMTVQTAPSGVFRPVGTESFGNGRRLPLHFDQQPVEAAATVSACIAAWNITHHAHWPDGAASAFAWFLGENDLAVPLADPQVGSCRDGLHRDRANENRGAESILSYLLASAEMRQLDRARPIKTQKECINLARSDRSRASTPGSSPGGYIVSVPVPEPTSAASQTGPIEGRRQALQASD